jgi:hypothetical protein
MVPDMTESYVPCAVWIEKMRHNRLNCSPSSIEACERIELVTDADEMADISPQMKKGDFVLTGEDWHTNETQRIKNIDREREQCPITSS